MKALIVHGGAWDIPDELISPHEEGCRAAHETGWRVLIQGGSCLDAVVAAVRIMEDDPTFDAGVGSFLNAEGEVELDAGVMVGAGMRAGAVASVRRLRNPVSAARSVLEEGQNVLLTGRGAEEFAERAGHPLCTPGDLRIAREVTRHRRGPEPGGDGLDPFGGLPSDTVGAVAVGDRGEVAVAVSTGGRPFKPRGRVGDTPVPGAGYVAEEGVGAVCCTGWGEGILRVSLARITADGLLGCSPRDACTRAISSLREKVSGRGGVIAVNPNGDIGFAFNTPRLAVAYGSEATAGTTSKVLSLKDLTPVHVSDSIEG